MPLLSGRIDAGKLQQFLGTASTRHVPGPRVVVGNATMDENYALEQEPLDKGLRADLLEPNGPFAVLLGDDLIDEAESPLSTMMEVQQKTGGSVTTLIELDP